jgi:hypothetical protein
MEALPRPSRATRKSNEAANYALMSIGLILVAFTSLVAFNKNSRRDLDNIAAILSKDYHHEQCKQIDCFDRSQRISAIIKEASKIPADIAKF